MFKYMLIYNSLFLLITIAVYYEYFGRKTKYIFLLLSIILIMYMSTFKWQVGTDWDSYFSMFQSAKTLGILEYISVNFRSWEILYLFLTWFLSNIVIYYFTYLFIFHSSLISLYLSIVFKNFKYPILTFSFLSSIYIGFIFAVPRQSIALAIIFYSYKYLIGSSKKFIIFVLIASLFHSSSLIFLLAPFIYGLSFKKIIVFTLSLFLILWNKELIIYILLNTEIIPFIIKNKILFYLSNPLHSGFYSIALKILTRLFVLILAFISLTYKKSSENNGMFNLYFFSIVIYLLSSNINFVFERFAYYYEISQVMIVLSFYDLFSRKGKYFILTLLLIYFYLRFYYSLNGGYHNLFIPFKTIFNNY